MNRLHQLALAFLCLTGFSFAQNEEIGMCYYFGDPHLIPFPKDCQPNLNQYICKPRAPEVIAINDFLKIEATSSVAGNFRIVEYTATFFGDGAYPAKCIITDKINGSTPFNPSCPTNSPVTLTLKSTSLLITHRTQNIEVFITKSRTSINIKIEQSMALIRVTKGVCVEFNCTLEKVLTSRPKRETNENSLNSDIAEKYAASAREQADNDVNEELLDGFKAACDYDVEITGDPADCESVITFVVEESIKRNNKGAADYAQKWSNGVDKAGKANDEIKDKIKSVIKKARDSCSRSSSIRECLKAYAKYQDDDTDTSNQRDEN